MGIAVSGVFILLLGFFGVWQNAVMMGSTMILSAIGLYLLTLTIALFSPDYEKREAYVQEVFKK